jgi:hypothetical protein
MAAKAFAGDLTHALPYGMVEPYRLWFEFLKLALGDPAIRVNHRIYKDWGNVLSAKFSDWWHDHWRPLFAVPNETRRVESAGEFADALKDQNSVVLRISLASTKKRRMEFIAQAIEQTLRDRSDLPSRVSEPRFKITGVQRLKLDKLRIMLRIYQFWLQSDGDLERAARCYHRWATGWNDRIRKGRWKRRAIDMPPYLVAYIGLLDRFAAGGGSRGATGRRSRSASAGNLENYDSMRNGTRRYLRRAIKIAQNVGRGVFPGKF